MHERYTKNKKFLASIPPGDLPPRDLHPPGNHPSQGLHPLCDHLSKGPPSPRILSSWGPHPLCDPPSQGHPLLSSETPPFHLPAQPWWGAEERDWKSVLGAWSFKLGQELPHSIHCSRLLPAATRSPGFYYITQNIIKALKTLP